MTDATDTDDSTDPDATTADAAAVKEEVAALIAEVRPFDEAALVDMTIEQLQYLLATIDPEEFVETNDAEGAADGDRQNAVAGATGDPSGYGSDMFTDGGDVSHISAGTRSDYGGADGDDDGGADGDEDTDLPPAGTRSAWERQGDRVDTTRSSEKRRSPRRRRRAAAARELERERSDD